MQAITAVPCYLALAHGNVRINLQVGVASVLLLVPLLIVLLDRLWCPGCRDLLVRDEPVYTPSLYVFPSPPVSPR